MTKLPDVDYLVQCAEYEYESDTTTLMGRYMHETISFEGNGLPQLVEKNPHLVRYEDFVFNPLLVTDVDSINNALATRVCGMVEGYSMWLIGDHKEKLEAIISEAREKTEPPRLSPTRKPPRSYAAAPVAALGPLLRLPEPEKL